MFLRKSEMIAEIIESLAKRGSKTLGKASRAKGSLITVPVGKSAPKAVQNAQKAKTALTRLSRREEILTQYCERNEFPIETVAERFKDAEKYLDEVSLERLLKLTEEGKIKLYERPKIRFSLKRDTVTDYLNPNTSWSILRSLNSEKHTAEEIQANATAIKELLALENEGKILPEHICNLLELNGNPEGLRELLAAIRSGRVCGTGGNLNQAMMMCSNGFSLKLLDAKNLDELSSAELKQLRKILAAKGTNKNRAKGLAEQAYRDKLCELDTPIMPMDSAKRTELLKEISRRLSTLTKVNRVPSEVANRFTENFSQIEKAFASATCSIDEIKALGGIKLQYSRDAFKESILGQISHLTRAEQNVILNKFNLTLENGNIISGHPVHLAQTEGLSKAEIAINEEINKFLFQNKIVLPKGCESYQAPLEEITRAIPEFLFTIGSKQHNAHDHLLAEHILKVFESNINNPLYKTLDESERRILGIATILHDLNKIEATEDVFHAVTSSQTTNAIMERFGSLSLAERDRITNLVANHHWLERIPAQQETLNSSLIEDLAFKFRSGNDFTMAKIFAESDLRGVSNKFIRTYGSKINSPTTEAIEREILRLQSLGRPIYTADITLEAALKAGGELRTIGEGAQQTQNVVIKASQLGLDSAPILYHAPATDDAFIMMESGLGYGTEGVFSLTLGKNGRSAVFQKRKEFMLFRRPSAYNIGYSSPKNGDTGAEKTYHCAQRFAQSNTHYATTARSNYHTLSGRELDEATYARLFRVIADKEPGTIYSIPEVQQILGGEREAMQFEKAIAQTTNSLIRGTKETTDISEVVAWDLRAGGIGTNRTAEEVSFEVRKMCENKYPIVEFD